MLLFWDRVSYCLGAHCFPALAGQWVKTSSFPCFSKMRLQTRGLGIQIRNLNPAWACSFLNWSLAPAPWSYKVTSFHPETTLFMPWIFAGILELKKNNSPVFKLWKDFGANDNIVSRIWTHTSWILAFLSNNPQEFFFPANAQPPEEDYMLSFLPRTVARCRSLNNLPRVQEQEHLSWQPRRDEGVVG